MLILSLILIISLVACDQLIKILIVNNYAECFGFAKNYYTFSIGNFDIFGLTHIRNDGAGWSILGGQTVFLIVFTSIVMLGILAYMILKRKKLGRFDFICFSLIVSGGIGNLIDRIRMLIEPDFNGVIDYINLSFIDFPVFNFADMCVVVGAIGYCVYVFATEISDMKQQKKKLQAPSEQTAQNGEDDEQV